MRATRLPYRRIAPYSLIAAPLWAGAEATAGYSAVHSLRWLITYGGPPLAAAFLTAAAALAGLAVRRRARAREASTSSPVAPPRAADAVTPATGHEYLL
ncbi:hypothetical protein ACFQ9J_17830 [Streptomyces sp. NPDC056529]|uniref:hypothetical protein n=1 Tax=Streptomyces sp. NPDC056529 TaxID=3345855 RepID=UPI00367935F6